MKMTVFEGIIDIGNEVIKFAHDQGHTKASKDTLNWSGLKSRSGNTKFTEKSYKKKSTSYTGDNEDFRNLAKHLVLKELEDFSDDVMSALVAYENNGESCYKEQVYIQDSFILNTYDEKKLCSVAFAPTCKNIAESLVKFTTTLICTTRDAESAPKIKLKRKSKEIKLIPPRNKIDSGSFKKGKNILTKVPLSPKFRSSLKLSAAEPKKIFLPKNERSEVVAKIPPGIKVPIEIIQTTEEESGIFEVEYYLWGVVQVTVWGKPCSFKITDILDSKNNDFFTRATISSEERRNSSMNFAEEIQVATITLHGSYESRKVSNQIKLRFPKCILRRPSYSVESLKCTCDTAELPISMENVLPLTNKNLAKIMFRWRQILYSFRSKHENNDNEWLWKMLLSNNTELATIATNLNVDQFCRVSTAIDKFVVTLLLWRGGCKGMDELKENGEDGEDKTRALIKQLYEVGIPVPVLNFLWQKEKWDPTSAYHCPIHRFEKETIPKLKDLKEPTISKIKAPLPDRVLTRLTQRWELQDGWASTAMYLGINLPNIHSLACNDVTFKTVTEKRLTVFKLWRMNQRRNSFDTRGQDGATMSGHCTTWDLCMKLHEMGLTETIYNFLWLDSETTP